MLQTTPFAQTHSRNVYQFFASLKTPTNPPTQTQINLRTGDPSATKVPCNSITNQNLKKNLLQDSSYFAPKNSISDAKGLIAKFHSTENVEVGEKDVFLYNGGDQCIFWAIKSICKEGDGVLIPRPTYWYFDLLGGVYGLDKKYYGTDIDEEWEVDFDDLVSKIDGRTKLLVFVNPGNPNCIAYSKETIAKYLEIAEKYNLTILADEIYFDSVFPGTTHTTIFQMPNYDTVPIILMCGLAKRFVVPGYCCEWLVVRDNSNKLLKQRQILTNLETIYGGPPTPLLQNLNFFFEMQNSEVNSQRMAIVQNNYEICKKAFSVFGGKVWKLSHSNAAFFAAVRFWVEDFRPELGIKNDLDMANQLAAEENLLVTPGSWCNEPKCFRIFLMSEKTEHYTQIVCRLKSFYARNKKA